MVESDLIKKFEKLSIDDKIDFLEGYDFVNDLVNRPYFVNFIKKNYETKNYWFSTILIDLASELRIYDVDLFNTYFNYLFTSKHYLIKLSVLDFQIETYDLYYDEMSKEAYIKVEELLNKKSERLLVKNQVLLNLMIYFKENRLKYLSQLIDNLKRTSDYRSHLRIYNTFINYDYYSFITPDFLEQLFNISERKNLGKSVSNKISELKSYNSGNLL